MAGGQVLHLLLSSAALAFPPDLVLAFLCNSTLILVRVSSALSPAGGTTRLKEGVVECLWVVLQELSHSVYNCRRCW